MTRVSVVICTYNRADSLRETLRCLHHQRYGQFEVVVVNGPSTDDTADVIAEFADVVRAEVCPVPNLSVSRNIGIRSAAGEIVAFIDDDALPEFDWLRQALPAFTDETVAGVGGIVFDHSGMALQYRYSAANRFGEATSNLRLPYDDLSAPGSFLFPYLQGTNALFRRSALEEIGGFDETFDYYLDETDVCCRLVDAGFVLRQLPDAPVHHKFLPSSIRSPERVVTNWFPIIKNQTYFAIRHALGARDAAAILDRAQANIEARVADARFHEDAGRLPPGTADRVVEIGREAVATGLELGLARATLRLDPLPPPHNEFAAYPVVDSSARLCIALVTGDYPPRSTGGIARFLGDLAPALAARGHEVRVITRAPAHGTVDLEDDVWVHRIECPPSPDGGVAPDTLPHIDGFVTASAAELQRIGTWRTIDVVYGPAWDVDVLGALRTTPLPVVAMLATPFAVALRHAGAFDDPESAAGLAGLMRAERRVFDQAHLVHAISGAILDTIRDEYGEGISPDRAAVGAIGLRDRRLSAAASSADGRGDDATSVLFVGRLEARKGIDDLLLAIAAVAPQHPDVVWQIAGGETRPMAPSHEDDFRSAHAGAPWLANVHFLGNVTDDELDALYERAGLVVLPSRYESFGLVMLEAMMHERAQVSCRIGGITEVVRDGVDGLLVPPADPDALGAAIAELLADPARRAAMGRAGRARFESEMTIDAATARVEEILRRPTLSTPGERHEQDGHDIVVHDGAGSVPIAAGRDGVRLGRRTRVVVPGRTDARRVASLWGSPGAQAVVRTRASHTTSVGLCAGWNAVELPRTADDVVITWRCGEVAFGGVVTIAGGPTT